MTFVPKYYDTKDKSSLKKVMKNLNKEVEGIRSRSLKGMIKAVSYMRRDMDKTPPLIPVDTNNMRSSWFTDPMPGHVLQMPVVVCGFTANYTFFVHEALDAVDFQRPDSGPKFFQASIERNYVKMLDIIMEESEV